MFILEVPTRQNDNILKKKNFFNEHRMVCSSKL